MNTNTPTESCRACGHPTAPYTTARVLNRHDVRYDRCPQCGLIQTETPHWLNEAYSEAIAGSAVLTIVPSSVCMKKPRETSQSSLFRMGESGAAGWGVDMCKGIFQKTRCFEFATAIAFLLAP